MVGNEMYSDFPLLWVFAVACGFLFILLIIFAMDNEGVFDGLKQRHILKIRKRQKRFLDYRDKREKEFNLTILIFGGTAIFIFFVLDSIKEWFDRNKWRIILTLVNIVMLVPLGLLISGVVYNLPEFYFPLLLFYGIIVLVYWASKSDQKRSGESGQRYDNWNGYYNNYNDINTKTPHEPIIYKPKPRGISQDLANKKKKKIKAKLLENEELKKKYSLTDD